jgi:hypothetical protein
MNDLVWIIGGCALAVAGCAILIWKKRIVIPDSAMQMADSAKDMADSAMNMGVNVVDRITEKFPNVRRSHPDPATKSGRTGAGLQGNLAQTPLHDLLQYLSLGSKSGILELTCGRRTGRVVLKDGKVYKNSYRGKEGLEAIFMMMDLAEGDFEFYEQVLEDASAQADLEVVDIIMLWMDRKPKKKQASG